jgi:hypothetical protein
MHFAKMAIFYQTNQAKERWRNLCQSHCQLFQKLPFFNQHFSIFWHFHGVSSNLTVDMQ